MKVIQSGNERLEVINSSCLWSLGFVLLGLGGFVQELFKFLHEHQNWHDFQADIPILVSVLFMAVGLFLCQRYRVFFDKSRREMTWTLSSAFVTKSRTIPLHLVEGADYEVDSNQFVNDHPKWGPKKRLVIRTKEGSLPLAGLYTYGSTSTDRVTAVINQFLGHRAT